ncbi:MerR family transcriptional regulator [Bacillus sp. 2205SS5-2]|uniref:MerR family transcriptional regulator n=1 Tax=Bacillus sp. 2205SS5-2 TaxID=3109031 RepID=UPI003005145C
MRYKMGQISQFMGISKDTIRHWQKKGLIEIERDDSDYHIFTDEDFYNVFKIRFYRDIGLSLQSIETLLNETNSQQKKSMLEDQVSLMDKQIDLLTFQRNVLSKAIDTPVITIHQPKLVSRKLKLKKVALAFKSTFSVSDMLQEKQLFLTSMNNQQDNHDLYVEVTEKEDFIFEHESFIQCFFKREELSDTHTSFPEIHEFAQKQELTLSGEIIEIHDLTQLFFNEEDQYVELLFALGDHGGGPWGRFFRYVW